jgi:hypothetical protein
VAAEKEKVEMQSRHTQEVEAIQLRFQEVENAKLSDLEIKVYVSFSNTTSI